MTTIRQPAIFTAPQTVYDAPELLFSMALDGEATWAGVRASLFNQSALTGKEREGFAERLKAAAGNTRVGDALVDVATNPLVWLYFATTPVGGSALAKGTGSMWSSVGKRYMAFVRRDGGILSGMKTASQALEGTSTHPINAQITSRLSGLEEDFAKRFHNALHKVYERNGIDSLNWADIHNPEKREKAQRLSAILVARLRGLDRKTSEVLYEVVDGLPEMRTAERQWFKGVDLNRVVRDEGLDEVVGVTRQFFKDRGALLLGDKERARRAFNLVRNRVINGGTLDEQTVQGAEIVRLVLGPMSEGMQVGKVAEDQFLKMYDAVVGNVLKGNEDLYFPRNAFDDIVDGQHVRPDAWRAKGANPMSGVRVTNSLYNREAHEVITHPGDLEHLAAIVREYGGETTEQFDKLLHQSKAVWRKATGDTPQRFQRINFAESLAKHQDSTARTVALTDVPSREVLESNKAVRDALGEQARVYKADDVGGIGYSSIKKEYREGLGEGLGDRVTEAMSDSVARGVTPPGGFSVSDALEADWKMLSHNGYAQRVLSDIVVPTMAGISTAKGIATMETLLRTKSVVSNMLDSKVGELLEGSGPGGKRFSEQLRNWAESKTTLQEARGYTRAVAGTIYVAHLGVNVGSVALNLMQPLISGPMLYGVGPLVHGYGQALKEMFGYMEERVSKYGFKAIPAHEKNALARKHFKFANVMRSDGGVDDVIGITKGPFEILDDTMKGGTGGIIGREKPWERWVFEYPMKMFEKAEWMNRNVMAHATEGFYRGRGLGALVGTPRFYEDVRRTVQETQFGSGVMNTPIAFQSVGRGADLTASGRLLANPLMRQFLTFQIRSFTSPFFASGRLAGAEREVLGMTVKHGGAALDIMRGIGFSALLYEVGKNLLKEDLSPALYVAAGTEIVPGFRGGRYDENEGLLPIPPVLDISFNAAKGLVTGDWNLIERQFSRLVPGGIAVGKAANLLQTGIPTPGVPQTTTVDWGAMSEDENGRMSVPLYDREGKLLNRRPVFDLVAESTGMRFTRPTYELERTMLANRDAAVELRRKAAVALQSGDHGGYQRALEEFRKRFGMEMQIGRDTLRQVERGLTSTRPERIMEGMPRDVRSQFDARAGSQGNPQVVRPLESPQ